MFCVMGIVDTMHLFKSGGLGNKGGNSGRDTGESSQQASVALRMIRIVVTGAGRIDDKRAAYHIRFHLVWLDT